MEKEMTEPLIVDVDSVRITWGKKFTEDWVMFDAGEITDAEFALFNASSNARLLGVTPVMDGDVEHILHLDHPPLSKPILMKHARDFLSIRRLLQRPTASEAIDLLAHPYELIRDYARARIAEWHKQWKEEKEACDETLNTGEENVSPAVSEMTEQELLEAAKKAQADYRREKRTI